MGGDPGQVSADACPEVVVAAVGDWLAVAVAQQWCGRWCGALLPMLEQVPHEGGRDRLPAHGVALLVEEDEALIRVEVGRS